MKHLKLFDTVQSYNTYKSNGQLALPNVSLCEDQQSIFYLPYDAEIEYLELTRINYYSPTYINTNLDLSSLDFKIYTKGGICGQYGWVHQNNGNGTWIAASYENGILSTYNRTYFSQYRNTNCIINPTDICIYDSKNGFFLNSERLCGFNVQIGSDFIYNNPLLIGAWYDFYAKKPQSEKGGYIRDVRVYINSILRFDAYPVRKGNVGYMYDKVSGQLFGNAGTGNFILGPDK